MKARNIPISKKAMQSENKVFLIGQNLSSFNIKLQLIHPSQSTTFATTQQPYNYTKKYNLE